METTTPYIVQDECTRCTEAISVEFNAPPARTARADGKRPFYPDTDKSQTTMVFRCRQCLEPVHETVPSAKFKD